MKIQLSNYEFTHKRRLKPERNVANPNVLMCNNVGLCDENKSRGYNVNFSGSAPKKSEAAAKSFMERIFKSGAFNWLVKFTGNHNVAAAALIALFLAGGLRPAITISLPGKKDLEDKMYAAGHSMASGIIGFGFSTLITTPIDSGIKYIFEDAKKMSKTDYDNLSSAELAEYIRKNNITPEDIAEKLANPSKPKEEILKELKEPKWKFLWFKSKEQVFVKSGKLAEYVKANNGIILPLRTIPKGLTIVSEKTDKINKLKHELFEEKQRIMAQEKSNNFRRFLNKTKKFIGLKEKAQQPIKLSARANDLAKQIRELSNHAEGINTTMHNISEWGIAIPRAMLTIALIPPILKYVFHVEKKNKDNKSNVQQTAQAPAQIKPIRTVRIKHKSMNEFVGGLK